MSLINIIDFCVNNIYIIVLILKCKLRFILNTIQ